MAGRDPPFPRRPMVLYRFAWGGGGDPANMSEQEWIVPESRQQPRRPRGDPSAAMK